MARFISICGLCDNRGAIYLNELEKEAYIVGQRIFEGPGNLRVARMRADDSGIRDNSVQPTGSRLPWYLRRGVPRLVSRIIISYNRYKIMPHK